MPFAVLNPPSAVAFWPFAKLPAPVAFAKVPCARLSPPAADAAKPLAVAKVPVAVARTPVAFAKVPHALEPSPVASAPAPRARPPLKVPMHTNCARACGAPMQAATTQPSAVAVNSVALAILWRIRIASPGVPSTPVFMSAPSCPEQPCRCARPPTPWQAWPRGSSTDFCKRRIRSLANGKRRLPDLATDTLDAAHARSPMANGDYATELLIRWTPHTPVRLWQTATTRLTD